jgi:post-segregation antitoxin (ccd killing protein)
MRMARVNVYLPDDLAEQARDAGLNVSGLTQEAVRRALAAARTDAWLDEVAGLRPTGVSHDDVITTIGEAREEFDRRDA